MFTINISEETNEAEEMADVLRSIACMIDNGFSAGVNPTWNLNGYLERELELLDTKGQAAETITISGQSYKVIVTEHEFFEDDKYTVYLPSREIALITSENVGKISIIQGAIYDGGDGREHVISYIDLPESCQNKLSTWFKEVCKWNH